MSHTKIIGLAGTNGSGKDTVGNMLAGKHGFLFVSVTDLLRTEAKKRDLPIERENLRAISAEWRRALGLGVLVDKALVEYEKVKDRYSGVAMASIRNSGEVERIHELGGTMVWVDADPKVRYNRVQANAASRGRVEEDNKTFEEFLVEEEAEMKSSGDSATLDMAAVKDRCDIFLNNDNNDLVAFQAEVEKALAL